MTGLGDELLWTLILFNIRAVWTSTSQALLGVVGCQALGPGAGGVGVRGLTLSLDSTTFGLSEARAVTLELDVISSDEKARSCTFIYASKKAILLISLMKQFAKDLIFWLVGWY
jgi:hypothetical protein